MTTAGLRGLRLQPACLRKQLLFQRRVRARGLLLCASHPRTVHVVTPSAPCTLSLQAHRAPCYSKQRALPRPFHSAHGSPAPRCHSPSTSRSPAALVGAPCLVRLAWCALLGAPRRPGPWHPHLSCCRFAASCRHPRTIWCRLLEDTRRKARGLRTAGATCSRTDDRQR